MIILLNNIKECFQKIIKKAEFGKTSILVIVSFDPDALCALKILIMENLLYKVLPVSGYQEMTQAIEDSKAIQDIKSIIFLNCGGIYNLSEFWFASLDSQIKAFVFDSHQPTHDVNVNSLNKIFVVDDGFSEINQCPNERELRMLEFHQNQEDSDEDEEIDKQSSASKQSFEDELENNDNDIYEDEEGNLIVGNKRRRRRELIEKKKQKKIKQQQSNSDYKYNEKYKPLKQNTKTIMRQVTFIVDLSALLGMTDAFINNRLSTANYEKLFGEMSNEVLLLNQIHLFQANQREQENINPQDIQVENFNKKCGVIFIENDYRFFLLRSQSLYNSMYYSNYIGSKLNLWNSKDNRILEDIIARLGVPLEEAKQIYKYMHHKYKIMLKEKMMDVASKFGLSEILYRSFIRQIDTKIQVTAADMVYCISAILEFPPILLDQYITEMKNKSLLSSQEERNQTYQQTTERSKNFWCAFDAIDNKSLELIEQGFNMATEFQKQLVDQAAFLLEKREISPSRNFRYTVLKNELVLDWKFFQHPSSLQKLAQLLMQIYKSQKTKQANKPIIICSPIQNSETVMVVGIVGANTFGGNSKNIFGNHFMRVVANQDLKFKQDNFETSIIEIHKDDFISFLEELVDNS